MCVYTARVDKATTGFWYMQEKQIIQKTRAHRPTDPGSASIESKLLRWKMHQVSSDLKKKKKLSWEHKCKGWSPAACTPSGLFQEKPEVQSHVHGDSPSLLSPLPSPHSAVVLSLQKEPLLPADKALLVLPAGNSVVSCKSDGFGVI